MTAFTVHRVPCTRCAGTGELSTDRDPQSPRVHRCPDCAEGVAGWEVREEPARFISADGSTRCARCCLHPDLCPCTPALIGTLPARTLDRESAETFAACLECVPGREVEALEHFAQWEVYPDWMIAELGIALTGPSPLAAAVGGGGR